MWLAISVVAAYFLAAWYRYYAACKIVRKVYGQNATVMRAQDNIMRLDSVYSPCTIHLSIVLEGNLSARDIIDMFKEVFKNGKEKLDRFRQRPILQYGLPFWVDDPDFSPSRHVHDANPELSPKNKEELGQYISELSSQTFPVDRPPWNVEVVPHFEGDDQTLLLIRMHHMIGDGIGIMCIFLNLLQENTGQSLSDDDLSKIRAKGSAKDWLWVYIRLMLIGPLIIIYNLFHPADNNSLNQQVLTGKKLVSMTQQYEFAMIRRVKQQLGATVNDVLCGVMGAALARLYKETGESSLKTINIYMPFNMRAGSQDLAINNQFSASLTPLSVANTDPIASILVAKKVCSAYKKTVAPLSYYFGMVFLGSSIFIPEFFGRFFLHFMSTKGTMVMTNVAGTKLPFKFGSSTVRDVFFWVPGHGRTDTCISTSTYSGKIQFGVAMDVGCGGTPDMILAKVDEVMQELCQAEKAGLSNGMPVKTD